MNQPFSWSRLDLLQQALVIAAAAVMLFLCAPYFGLSFFGGASPVRTAAPPVRAPLHEAPRATPAPAKNLEEIEELLK